mgnify:CR=1 FL=1
MKEKNEDNLIDYDDEERILLKDDKREQERKSKDFLLNVLQNLERDLVIKNNCKKEFNLENEIDENNHEQIKVFGNPKCFICLSSYKTDSSIQLFYCSHCDKLLCKSCLTLHYKSSFKNIQNSYIKYKSPGNEDLINKKLKPNLGRSKLFLFIFGLIFFNAIYIIPIFTMKSIQSCLETVLYNCIKEVFTHKIEEPNSLFNFYEIFFNKIDILNFNFELIMIMNWLGERILYSCGLIITMIIFIGINSLHFILLLNFDFLEYNENNKYGIWKFVHLSLIYILLFVGLGGSSLLSQIVLIQIS